MIDLRREMTKVLRQWGHDIYLQRWKNNRYDDALEKHTVRQTYPRMSSLANTELFSKETVIQDVDLFFYFSWDVNPRENDRLYEEDPRYASNHSIWRIKYALPMRGRGGRIEYWVCGSNRESPT